MADIYHQIGVKADITDVFQAINSLDGLANWWTKTTGDTTVEGRPTNLRQLLTYTMARTI
jgi:uncharacterized protein YndB with AHSA1/START domain